MGSLNVTQSSGWCKIWKLAIPNKVKTFLWRFCRNNVPVRRRLSSKGISLPITCPMCNADVEHLLHVFFDCPFAHNCWQYTGGSFDMHAVEFAPDWLLWQLSNVSDSELIRIAKVLWGIWFFRNKKVWESKIVTHVVAMDWSAKILSDWENAKQRRANMVPSTLTSISHAPPVWKPPDAGCFKLNVDASFHAGANTFSVGLVLRNHEGMFIIGKAVCCEGASSPLEAEATAIFEGLSWLTSLPYQKVSIESDSLICIQSIHRADDNLFEVGDILESCRTLLNSSTGLSISFVKRQANKVAHEVAKLPCSLNCPNIFTSPPLVLMEAILYDFPH